jgi:hypothetical protein
MKNVNDGISIIDVIWCQMRWKGDRRKNLSPFQGTASVTNLDIFNIIQNQYTPIMNFLLLNSSNICLTLTSRATGIPAETMLEQEDSKSPISL